MTKACLLMHALWLLAACPSHARTWTSSDGSRTFEGDFVSVDPDTGMVTVERGGQKLSFSQDKLSEEDRDFIALQMPPVEEPIPEGFGSWETILKDLHAKEGMPALGGIVIHNGKIGNPEAYGLRKFGGSEAVAPEDKWHIGSCTKSMTATLVATFVEEGRLNWDSTIGELLGDKIEIGEPYRDVTLHLLLTHRSGIPGAVPAPIWRAAWAGNDGKDIREMRLEFLEDMLDLAPSSEPGTAYEYSNSGFITAGAMLEALTGESWENLMLERVFEPLGMDSAGFGAPATPGEEDQPWPHANSREPVTGATDNPRILGPAGTVHASLLDLAKYVRMHLLRETGRVLQKEETFELLHTAPPGNRDYACGWITARRAGVQGVALTHAGSNTMNYCLIWAFPERKFATIVVTNSGEDKMEDVCDQASSQAIEQFLK